MFDIGFSELVVVAVVALIVIGPERLPTVARTLGKWVGSVQRFVRSVKSDIDAEINKSEELKSLMQEQEEIKSAHQLLENSLGDLDQPSPVPRRPAAASPPMAIGSEAKPVSATPEVISETVKPSALDSKQSNG